MSTRILTVDGNWLAMSKFMPLVGHDDAVAQAALAFLRDVDRVCERFRPEVVAVAWDSKESHRKNKLPSYKAQRPPKPEGFSDALRQIKKHLEEGSVYQFSSGGWEGDDVIATIVRTMPGPHIIYSVDKDLFQLIEPGVSYYRALGGGVLYNSDNLEEETGLTAEGWTSYLSLMGDSADNLKGVPGVGDVGARRILSAYPGIVSKLMSSESRQGTLAEARGLADKKTLAVIERAAKHHESLTETWLAVQLQTVGLEVVMPEGL